MKTANKARWCILAVDAGLLIFALLARHLAATMMKYLPECVYSPAGITCPACGATRCVRYLFSGQPFTAFRLHPYIFLLIFYLAVALIILNIGYLLNKNRFRKIGMTMVGSRAIILLAAGFGIFGMIRLFVTLP